MGCRQRRIPETILKERHRLYKSSRYRRGDWQQYLEEGQTLYKSRSHRSARFGDNTERKRRGYTNHDTTGGDGDNTEGKGRGYTN